MCGLSGIRMACYIFDWYRFNRSGHMECTAVRCVRRIRQKSCRSPAVKNCRSRHVIRQTPVRLYSVYMLHNRFPWKRSGRRSPVWPPYSLRRNLSAAACRPCDRSWILRGYAIRSGRRPEGSQRPQCGPQVRPGRWLPEGRLPDRIA